MILLYADITALQSGEYSDLSDIIDIHVTENRNGGFELEMSYLYAGENASLIVPDAIIMSTPSKGTDAEPFRIYDVSTPIDGVLTAKARHICYDMDGVYVEPFNVTGITAVINAFNTLLTNQLGYMRLVNNGITNSTSQLSTSFPQSLFSLVGGSHSILSVFGGELSYHWDAANGREDVIINYARGISSNQEISYGVNLISLVSDVSNESAYSAIYPFAKYDNNGTPAVVTLTEKTLSTGSTTPKTRVLPVDLSQSFEERPTEAELRTAALAYIAANDWDNKHTVSFDFVPLENTTEYLNQGYSDGLHLCDTCQVSAVIIGIETTVKIIKTVYNPLTDKYDSMTAGSLEETIADTIASMSAQTSAVPEIETKLKYYDDTSGQTITIGSNHYATVAYPSAVQGHKVVSIGLTTWQSVSGSIVIYPYGQGNAVNWYPYGEEGAKIVGARFRYWYI